MIDSTNPAFDPTDYEGAVSAVFGASLSLMAILIAVMAILLSEVISVGEEVYLLKESTVPLIIGAGLCLVVSGWNAFWSVLYLFKIRNKNRHLKFIFIPTLFVVFLLPLGAIVWAIGEL